MMTAIIYTVGFMFYWLLISLIITPIVNKMFGNPLFENFWAKYFFTLFLTVILSLFGLI